MCIKEGLPVIFGYISGKPGEDKFTCYSSASLESYQMELKERIIKIHNDFISNSVSDDNNNYRRKSYCNFSVYPPVIRVPNTS